MMNNSCKCGRCTTCQEKKKCANPCGCVEPVFSIEALSTDPTTLKFNVNGKTVWYDFSSLVKAAETCTTLVPDAVDRMLTYNGECGENNITAKELGSILHLADIGDVAEETINDNGILVYQKDPNCAEGCDGISNGWISQSPIEVGATSLDYILGSDSEGRMSSLMPPTDSNSFSYLAWAGADKASWKKPSVVATPPLDADGKVWRLYVDPNTYELVISKENP